MKVVYKSTTDELVSLMGGHGMISHMEVTGKELELLRTEAKVDPERHAGLVPWENSLLFRGFPVKVVE